MPYEIVPYTPALDAQIADLQRHLWSSDLQRNGAYFRWKYVDNPFVDEIVMQLVLFDGRLVAMHGMIGALWEVGDVRRLVPQTEDLVVAPEHRNRGVATQMMRANLRAAGLRGFPCLASMTAGPRTFRIATATGWRPVGRYAIARRKTASSGVRQKIRNWIRHMRRYRRVRAVLPAPNPSGPFARLDRRAAGCSGSLSVSRAPRPPEMAGLVAGLPWDGRMRHIRNAEYFAWRFRNPLHEYRFLFWDDHGLRGYLVLQRYLSDYGDHGLVNIVDWEASDDQIRRRLLEGALRVGRFQRIQMWTVGISDPARALLRDHGFEALEPDGMSTLGNTLFIFRLDGEPSSEPCFVAGRDLHNIADWDLRMLYSMAG